MGERVTICDASKQLKNIVCDCGAVLISQVSILLLQDGWSPEKCTRIIEKALKHQLIFREGDYLVKTPVLSKKNATEGLKKAFWFYLHQRKNIGFCTFTVKLPSSMMFSTKGIDESKVYHLFYIPRGREGFYVNLIESEFSNNAKYGIDAFIIIDEYTQIDMISLPEYIKINAFIIVDKEIETDILDNPSKLCNHFEMYKPKPARKKFD